MRPPSDQIGEGGPHILYDGLCRRRLVHEPVDLTGLLSDHDDESRKLILDVEFGHSSTDSVCGARKNGSGTRISHPNSIRHTQYMYLVSGLSSGEVEGGVLKPKEGERYNEKGDQEESHVQYCVDRCQRCSASLAQVVQCFFFWVLDHLY
jgi:hypothetical protein